LVAWKNMSDPGRQQFLWPHPGEPRGEDSSVFKPGEQLTAAFILKHPWRRRLPLVTADWLASAACT
jgi:hypothetical protein